MRTSPTLSDSSGLRNLDRRRHREIVTFSPGRQCLAGTGFRIASSSPRCQNLVRWNERVLQFCRTTQQGFLRLASNPAVLKERAVTLKKAWLAYDKITGDPRISLAVEPPGIEPQWRAYTRRNTYSPNVWNDVYLAAFAKCADLEVVTFDKAFGQFKGVRCNILA